MRARRGRTCYGAAVTRCVAGCSVVLAALCCAGCLQPRRYPCEQDDQCELDGEPGVCRTGWCAYADEDCASMLRWSPHADPDVAKACVPSEQGTGTSSGTSTGAGTSTGDTSTTDTGTSSSTGAPDCASICMPGPHATAAACDETDTCVSTCEPPWQDCDGDPANGCEVPVGVPHQCDAEGLDPVEGCWTAWCGETMAEFAVNFGTYYCIDCVTCQEPTAGMCRWCNHDTGNWYMADACACSPEGLGAVCGP